MVVWGPRVFVPAIREEQQDVYASSEDNVEHSQVSQARFIAGLHSISQIGRIYGRLSKLWSFSVT